VGKLEEEEWMGSHRTWVMAMLAIAMVATACGGDDESSNAAASSETTAAMTATTAAMTATTAASTATTAAPSGSQDTSGGAGNSGHLVLGEETIVFDSARCYLQEQDAAAGGGKILFTAQAFGTNAAGDPITVDVSRYDQDSQFTGDDVIVDIGDPLSGDAVSLRSSSDVGTITVDGSTLRADGLTLTNLDDFTEQSGSFEINC
jgi:hypothetical protein